MINTQHACFRFFAWMLLAAMLHFVMPATLAAMPRQGNGKALLKEGKALWDQFDETGAIDVLKQALTAGLSPNDAIEARQVLAQCYAAQRENDLIKQQYLEILKLDAAYRVNLTESQVLRDAFAKAKREFDTLDHQPPELGEVRLSEVAENTPLTIQIKATDATGVGQVKLTYQQKGGRRRYPVVMKKTSGDLYEAKVPARHMEAPGIEYVIEARDVLDNPPAYVGSFDHPVAVLLDAVDSEPPRITHRPPEDALVNESLQITATIEDNVAVTQAALRLFDNEKRNFQSIVMQKEGRHQWNARVPAFLLAQSPLKYYLSASDEAGNEGLWQSAIKPYELRLKSAAPPKPVADAGTTAKTEIKPKKKGSKAWLWILLGGAAAGGIALALGGGGGGGDDTPSNGTISVTVPQNP